MRNKLREPEMRSESFFDPLTSAGLLITGAAVGFYAIGKRPKLSMGLAATGGLMALAGGSRVALKPRTVDAVTSFAINCLPSEAYMYWRQLENLPRFMKHLQSVEIMDDTHSVWTALGPMNMRFQWTAEITEEKHNEKIAWRSTPDSDLQVTGEVNFRPAPGDRGTILTARVHYDIPGGKLGTALASLFGKNPKWNIREDVRRFKALMEAGEIPTIEGQTHGPRSTMVSAMHRMYSETEMPSERIPPGQMPSNQVNDPRFAQQQQRRAS
jgi:uncharacterized membrane protein